MTFILVIEDPKDHVSPGQTIVGKAYCSLQSPRFLDVKLRVIGEECTYYNERASTNRSPTRGERCWRIRFLKTKNIIIRRGYFNIGDHKFPFKLTLPACIPGSYSGKYGHVKYFLKASLIANPREIEEDEIEFKVFTPTDLNDMPNVSMVPCTYTEVLSTRRWFCFHESIYMDVKLEKNAFILGETINVDVELANNSSLPVTSVLVELYLKIMAKVSLPMYKFLTVYQLLASDQRTGVHPHKSKTYLFQLQVPEGADIPNFQKCDLLSHKAFLEVTAVMKNSSKPHLAKINAEIVLGHYAEEGQTSISKNARDFVVFCQPTPDMLSTNFSRAMYNNSTRSTENVSGHQLSDPPPYLMPNTPPYPTDNSRGYGMINPLYRPESSSGYTTEEESLSLPREMPMPLRSLDSIYSDPPPPYPTIHCEHADNQMPIPYRVGNTATHLHRERPHSTLGFAELVPMAAPSRRSAVIMRDSIGFLTTPQSVDASQPMNGMEDVPSAAPPNAETSGLEDALLSEATGPLTLPTIQLSSPPTTSAEERGGLFLMETIFYSDEPPSYEEACRLWSQNVRLKRKQALDS